jgi:hypothetical protein
VASREKTDELARRPSSRHRQPGWRFRGRKSGREVRARQRGRALGIPDLRQASLRGAERTLAQYRQILELEDLESYRLVKADSGETLEIVEDKESGEFQLKATGVTEPEPQESEEEPPGESPTPTPPQAESPAPETP